MNFQKLLFCLIGFAILDGQGLNAQNLKRFKKNVSVLSDDKMMGRDSRRPEIWMAAEYIQKQFKKVGLEKPYEEGYYQRFTIPTTEIESPNVIGLIRASQPTNESILFTAHFDGLGVGKANDEGDSIYNGALDNAVGIAAMIELADDLRKMKDLKKNIVFIATSAEEIGSFGSEAYLEKPLFPANNITFVLNIDGFNVYGKTSDIHIMPRKGISFYDTIAKVGAENGFEDTTPDWVDGLNRGFDSAVFLAEGIPSITIWSGDKIEGMTPEESSQFKRIFGRNHHSPNDEMGSHWKWDGIKGHLMLYKKLAEYFLGVENGGSVTDKSLFAK